MITLMDMYGSRNNIFDFHQMSKKYRYWNKLYNILCYVFMRYTHFVVILMGYVVAVECRLIAKWPCCCLLLLSFVAKDEFAAVQLLCTVSLLSHRTL